MMIRILSVFAGLCVFLTLSGDAWAKAKSLVPPATETVPTAKPQYSPEPSLTTGQEDDSTSVIVTIRHLNGEREYFGSNLDSMDLIFDKTGRLDSIHMILLTKGEKDTHRWYLMQNLASFDYRFVNVAGKGKVRMRQLQTIKEPSESKASKDGADEKSQASSQPTYHPLQERDYH
jgi:hypothetical protein